MGVWLTLIHGQRSGWILIGDRNLLLEVLYNHVKEHRLFLFDHFKTFTSPLKVWTVVVLELLTIILAGDLGQALENELRDSGRISSYGKFDPIKESVNAPLSYSVQGLSWVELFIN